MTFNLVVQTKLAVSTLWRQIRLNLKEEVYVNLCELILLWSYEYLQFLQDF